MPTFGELLKTRASAYFKASEIINKQAAEADDPLETHALYKVAKTLWMEYGRYTRLAKEATEKENHMSIEGKNKAVAKLEVLYNGVRETSAAKVLLPVQDAADVLDYIAELEAKVTNREQTEVQKVEA